MKSSVSETSRELQGSSLAGLFMDRKITALKAQRINPNRVNVYLDGEFAFGVSRIVAAWLKVGEVLGDERIATLQDQDATEKAFQKALVQISYRPRSESEIQKKLVESGFELKTIETVLERLRKAGLVEDQSFAHTWIENRSTFRPRSQRFLTYELRQKGVQDEVIEKALTEAADDDTLAYQAALQYARRLKALDRMEFRKKLSGFLGRRGFSYGTINPIVTKVWMESRQEVERDPQLNNEDDENGKF